MPNLSNAQYQKVTEANQADTRIDKPTPIEIINNRMRIIAEEIHVRCNNLSLISDRLFGAEPVAPVGLEESDIAPGQYGELQSNMLGLEKAYENLVYQVERLQEKA